MIGKRRRRIGHRRARHLGADVAPLDLETGMLAPMPPFVVKLEQPCDDCGGSGRDWGSLDPIDPEDCPVCHGSGRQTVTRNYLVEALKIAAGHSPIDAQREHVQAIVQHCRALVSAVIQIADS